MPDTYRRVIWRLAERKNHRRSRRIGPPTAPFASHALISSFGSRSPEARSSSVRLLPCIALLAPLKKNEPVKVLPPVRGTTFIVGPPVSASPSPPDSV